MADAGLFAVALGGLIGILGAITGPIVQHYLSAKTRDDEARKNSVTDLILCVHELDAWLDTFRRKDAFGKEEVLGPTPFGKIEALVRVHFPESAPQLAALNYAIACHRSWTIDRLKERVEGKPTTELEKFKEISQDLSLSAANLIASVAGGRQWHSSEVFAKPE